MSNAIERFENELKSKISHKSSSFQSEEGFLIKQFKFFDIYNAGKLDFNNFYRTVEKIGIVMDKDEINQLYPHLSGIDENGNVDYRQYATDLYSSSKLPTYVAPKTATTYSPSKSPVYEESEGGTPQYTILRSGMNSQDYPLATTAHLYRPSTNAGRKSLMNPDYVDEQSLESLKQNLKDPNPYLPQDDESQSMHSDSVHSYNYGAEDSYYRGNSYSQSMAPKSQVLYVERFKEELKYRGGRGLIGLLKQFKIFDADSSGFLDKYEFKKAVEDYEVNIHPKDLENLFRTFDVNGDDRVNYNEFLNTLAGPMGKYRLQLVMRVFDKLDVDSEGLIEMNDMLACYDSSRHPDVASGKNDPEGAYNEFKDSFEVFHNIVHDYDSTARISKDEFTTYYTFVSAQIDHDSHFDQLINSVWNMDNKNNYDEMPYAGAPQKVTKINSHTAWLNDHHRKLFIGEETDIMVNPQNKYEWKSTHNSKYRSGIPAASVTAGVPTRPVGAMPTWDGGQMHDDQRVDHYYEAASEEASYQ